MFIFDLFLKSLWNLVGGEILLVLIFGKSFWTEKVSISFLQATA